MQSVDLQDAIPDIESVEPQENVMERSRDRSDLRALRQDVEARKLGVRVTKGAYFPTIKLLGNYYTKRVGFQEPIDWDVLFTINQPIFQGGARVAQMKQAQSALRESERTLEKAVRQVDNEIRRNYISLKSSVNQTKSLREAHAKAEDSYRSLVKDYRLGLANNLEVLQGMQTLQGAKRDLDRTLVDAKIGYLLLKVSTEEMP